MLDGCTLCSWNVGMIYVIPCLVSLSHLVTSFSFYAFICTWMVWYFNSLSATMISKMPMISSLFSATSWHQALKMSIPQGQRGGTRRRFTQCNLGEFQMWAVARHKKSMWLRRGPEMPHKILPNFTKKREDAFLMPRNYWSECIQFSCNWIYLRMNERELQHDFCCSFGPSADHSFPTICWGCNL